MRLIAIALIALTLASCGRLKRTAKTEDTYDKQVDKVELTEQVTVKETIDTIVAIAGDSSSTTIDIKDLTDTAVVVIDNDVQDVVIRYDSNTGKIHVKSRVKPRLIPVEKTRETVVNKRVDSSSKSVHKSSAEDKQTTKTNPLVPFWIWFLALLVVLGYLCFRYVIKI